MSYHAIVANGQHVYWLTYPPDRGQDQRDPLRFDLQRERKPEPIKSIDEANQQLKRKPQIPANHL